MPKVTALYVRVSSKQHDLRSQEPDLKRWVDGHDEPVAWYTDKFTGRTLDRPGMKRLLADVAGGKVGTIVVWRLDRLGDIGSMKARTHYQAMRRGHPGEWTCDDVEAARLQANETARPWGLHGSTPKEAWRQRTVISVEERTAFGRAVNRHEVEARQASSGPERSQAGRLRRAAIGQALVALGLLKYRRCPGRHCAPDTADR